ncbi:MAG: hypothetical protein JW761_04530, partial [Prolixibacteraceae bacterium]|nr:hypothetical protein [Prolixibacteraceae bacterium]
MKNKTALTLLLILFFGINAFSFNTFKNIPDKINNTPAFEVAACPDNVTNNTIVASSTTICSGESVTFTGSEPDITPDMDSTF